MQRCCHGDSIQLSYLDPQGGRVHSDFECEMDNECSAAAVEKYIKSEKIGVQLVPQHNHCANATKCAIATFKKHFIAALATVDTHCPLQLWDAFRPQVELTLNMLHFSHRDPKKSANQEIWNF